MVKPTVPTRLAITNRLVFFFLFQMTANAKTKTKTAIMLTGKPTKVSAPRPFRTNLRTDRIKITTTELFKSNRTKASKIGIVLKSTFKKSIPIDS